MSGYALFINGEHVGELPKVEIELKQDLSKFDIKELILELDGEKYQVYMKESEFERLRNKQV